MRIVLLFFAICFLAIQSQAQDPHLSQFYASPVSLNPAFSGAGICGARFNMNYRNQWPGISNSYQTYMVSYDQALPAYKSGIGVLVSNDVAGDGLLTTRSIALAYSYRVQLNKHLNLQLGMQGTYIQRSIDFSKLKFRDQIDKYAGFIYQTSEVLPQNSISFPSLTSGVLLYNESFYAGLSVHHMNQPYQSFYGNTGPGTVLPTRYTMHGGIKFSRKIRGRFDPSTWQFSPNILLMVQAEFTEMNLGFYARKNGLTSGIWFRQTGANADAVIFLLGYELNSFKFGYSYDASVSSIRPAATGSHEISLGFTLCRSKGPKPKTSSNICPSF